MSGISPETLPWSRDLTPSRQVGRASIFVNPTDGNVVSQLSLFPLWTRAGVGISLIHNADSTRAGQAGTGWVFSLNERIFDNDPIDATYMRADGREYTFTGAGPTYTRPSGIFATLKELSGGGWLLLDWQTFGVKTFNSAGWLVEVRDRNGNRVTVVRNASHEITKVTTDDTGETVDLLDSFAYNANGDMTKVGHSRCGGWEWLIAYDASDRPNKLTDPAANTFDLTYDSTSSRIASWADWRGKTTSATYTAGKANVLTDPLGKTDTWAYPTGAQTTVTDRLAKVWTWDHASGAVTAWTPPVAAMKETWTYNADFQVLTRSNQIPATWTWTYDSLGNVATYVDAESNTWTYGTDQTEAEIGPSETTTTNPSGSKTTVRLDAQGNVLATLTAMGFVTEYVVSGRGDVVRVKDPTGRERGTDYDPLTGRPVKTYALAKPANGATADAPDGMCREGVVATAWDDLLQWLPARTQDADDVATTMRYNLVGDLVETATYADGVKQPTAYTHDADGNVLTTEDAVGAKVTRTYSDTNLELTITDPENNLTTLTRDDRGQVTRREDPALNDWDFTYDDAMRQLTKKTPLLDVETTTYDAASNVTNLNDYLGYDWKWEFDLNNRLTKRRVPTTGASFADTAYSYDADGNLETVTDALGSVTTNVYDEDGRHIETQKPLGWVQRMHYDPAGRVVGSIDAVGAATTYRYDPMGRQTGVTDPRGATTKTTYTPGGRVQTTTDAMGHTTSNAYDTAGRLMRVTNALGGVTTYEHDAAGRQTAVAGADCSRTERVYDANGQVVLVRVKSSRDDRTYWLETATTYNSRGLPDKVTGPSGAITGHTYNANGELTKVTKDEGGIGATVDYTLDAKGQRTKIEESLDATTKTEHTITYNKAGWVTQDKWKVDAVPTYEQTDYALDLNFNVTAVTFPNSATYVYVFDSLGRRTKWTNRIGEVTEYEFDLMGRLTLQKDPDGDLTILSHDSAGNLVERTFRGDSTDTTQDVVEEYTYNALNRLATREDADERVSTLSYNALGQLESVTDAAGSTRTNVYSNGGQMTAQLGPAGERIDYEYTCDGRIAKVTGFDGFVNEYLWCCCGLEAYTDSQGTTLIERNALQHVTGITYPTDLTITLVPNHLGWVDKVTLPNTASTEDTDYTYDLRGRVLTIKVPDTIPSTITVTRDSMGWITTVAYAANHTVVYTLDNEGKVTLVTSTGKDASNTYSLTYAYVSNSSRVSSVTVKQSVTTVATQTYTYNARRQVTKEKVQDGVPSTTFERDYTWSAAGLRTKVDDIEEQWDSTFEYGKAGHLALIQTTDNSGATKTNPFPWWEGDNQVTSAASGDVLSIVNGTNRIAYRYDHEHRLVEAQMGSGDPVKVTYDGMGNLVSIVQGSTTQKTLSWQGHVWQTRNAADVLQDRHFWMEGRYLRLNIDSAARNQVWDARGSNDLSYQADGTFDKGRIWDNWGIEVFAAGAGAAPDVGFLSQFELGTSGLGITPQNNAWWAELGRNVEGGWRPRYFCFFGLWGCEPDPEQLPCYSAATGDEVSCSICDEERLDAEAGCPNGCACIWCSDASGLKARGCPTPGRVVTCTYDPATEEYVCEDPGATGPGNPPPDERPEDPLLRCYWIWQYDQGLCYVFSIGSHAELALCLGFAYNNYVACLASVAID